jgi:hypothetical protein
MSARVGLLLAAGIVAVAAGSVALIVAGSLLRSALG